MPFRTELQRSHWRLAPLSIGGGCGQGRRPPETPLTRGTTHDRIQPPHAAAGRSGGGYGSQLVMLAQVLVLPDNMAAVGFLAVPPDDPVAHLHAVAAQWAQCS